jgi:transposase-like protein
MIDMVTCPGCGQERPAKNKRGELRTYCRWACWLQEKQRSASVDREATKECPRCGDEMPRYDFGGRERVYCSKACRYDWERIIDEVVVDRLIKGHHVDSTLDERHEATRRMADMGIPIREQARRMHVTDRAVNRYRRDLHLNERNIQTREMESA